MKNRDPQPDPLVHADLYAKPAKQLAAEIRQFVDEERQHVIDNPACPGAHPFRCGHILALRFAELLDEVSENGETFMGYGELQRGLDHCAVTYLPALLVTIVERCAVEGVFVDGGLEKIVQNTVAKVANQTATERSLARTRRR